MSAAANKEVRVTFRGINKTKQAFSTIHRSFYSLKAPLKQFRSEMRQATLSFGKVGLAAGAAFSISMIKKIVDSGEQIGRLAAKLNTSTHALSELKYAGKQCGVEFETLSNGLKNLTDRIGDAAGGGGKAKEALELLKLSAEDLSKLASDQQFDKIAQSLVRVANSSDRAELAMRLFGSEGAKLLPLLEEGTVNIGRLREEARKLGASLSQEDCKAMASFSAELTKLQTVLTALLQSVLIPILPALTAFFAAMRDGNPAIVFIITTVSTLLAFRLAAWFIAAAGAVKWFTLCLAGNPLGLVAAAASLTVAALVTLTTWFNRSKDSIKEYNSTLVETINLEKIHLPQQEKAIAALSKRNELQNEAKRIFEQTRTPLEKHNEQIEKLNKLLKQGLIDQDTYNRAIKQSAGQLEVIEHEAEDVFNVIKQHSNDASKSMVDDFANAAFGVDNHTRSMQRGFGDLFRGLQADILKLTIKQGLFGANGSGGLLGGLGIGGGFGNALKGTSAFGGFFAKGGTAKPRKAHVVGDGGEPELFIPNTVGSIVPQSQLAGSGGNNISVHMNIQTPDLASFNHSRSQIAADIARQIGRASRNL